MIAYETGPAPTAEDDERMRRAWQGIRGRADFSDREVWAGRAMPKLSVVDVLKEPVPVTAQVHNYEFRVLETKPGAGEVRTKGVFGRRMGSTDPWTGVEVING